MGLMRSLMDQYIMGLIWINMVRVTTHNYYYNITYITVYNYRFDKLEDFTNWMATKFSRNGLFSWNSQDFVIPGPG